MLKVFTLIAVVLLLIVATELIFKYRFQKIHFLLVLFAIILLTSVNLAGLKNNVLMKKGVIYTGENNSCTIKMAICPGIDVNNTLSGILWIRSNNEISLSQENSIYLTCEYGVSTTNIVLFNNENTLAVLLTLDYVDCNRKMNDAQLTVNGININLKEQFWLKTLYTEKKQAYIWHSYEEFPI